MVARTAVLFDIDGTLIDTGGAGARSWKHAFQEVYGIPGDITHFSEVGMTDPVVARQTFVGTLGRDPRDGELADADHGVRARSARRGGGLGGLPRAARAWSTCLRSLSVSSNGARPRLGQRGRCRPHQDRARPPQPVLPLRWVRDRLGRPGRADARGHRQGGGRCSAIPSDHTDVFVVGDTPRDVEAAHGAGAIVGGGRYRSSTRKPSSATPVPTTCWRIFRRRSPRCRDRSLGRLREPPSRTPRPRAPGCATTVGSCWFPRRR